MGRRFMVCMFALVAFSASAAQGVHGGHNGQSVIAGADGGNGSNGGDSDNSSGRAGCPAAPIPISTAIFTCPAPANPVIPGPRMQRKSGLPASVQLRSCSALSDGGES